MIRRSISRDLLLPLVVGLMLAAAMPPAPASAQTDAPAPAPAPKVTAAELKSLLATLVDEAARKKLEAQLRALIAVREGERAKAKAAPAAASFLAALSEQVKLASGALVEASSVVLEAPKLWHWLRDQITDPAARARWFEGLWQIALALGLGFAAEWAGRALLAPARRAIERRRIDSVLVRVPLLAARSGLDLVPIAAFAVAAYGALSFTEPREATRLIALTLVNANVLARAVLAAARLILVPRAPSLRLFELADESAAYLFVWARRLVTIAVYGYFLAEASLLLGLPAAGYGFLRRVIGLLLAVMAVVLILQSKRSVAGWLQGAGGGPAALRMLRARAAATWHVFAVLYVGAVYMVWAAGLRGGFEYLFRATALTVAILVAAGLLVLGVRRGVERIFAIRADLKARYPLLQERTNRYLPVLHAILRGVISAVAALAVLQAWELDVLAWLASEPGRRVLGSAASIAVIVVVAILVWEIISSAIESYLGKTDEEGEAVERSARARTLLPLARKAVLVVLVVFVSLIVLSELGINIGPLLAGAGVVGLAVGFGAQTLVKDFITGLFILLEDTVAVGDVVDVAGHAGVVEALSIRTIRLRDYSGVVHTVPFSEVTTVRNLTKDYSYALFEIGVAYRENVDEVMALMREVGDELRADPEFGPDILEPLDVAGLDKFGDSAVVIKARLKVRPIKQWNTMREYNRRLKAVFDARGVEIPFPHTTIYFGEDKEGQAPPAHLSIGDKEAKERLGGAAEPARAARPDKPATRYARGDTGDGDGGDAPA